MMFHEVNAEMWGIMRYNEVYNEVYQIKSNMRYN